MTKLTQTFEKTRRVNGEVQHQVIELSVSVSSFEEVDDLSYNEFTADLFINKKYISDISHVLDDAGVFTSMVDSVDWVELYKETIADKGCEHSDKMQEVDHE